MGVGRSSGPAPSEERSQVPVAPVPVPVDPALLIEHAPTILALVDAEGTIVWVSTMVWDFGGFEPAELIGRPIFELLDLDWNPRVLASIGYALDTPGLRLPAMLRMRTKAGGWRFLEAMANNQIANPQIGALVVSLRQCDDQQLLDAMLESSAADRPAQESLALVSELGAGPTLRADSLVVLRPPGGHATTIAAEVAPDLAALVAGGGPGSPWAVALNTGLPVRVAVSDLPEPLAGLAAAAGYRTCWADPVPSARGGNVAALVHWRREEGAPEPSAEMLCGRLVHLVALVLDREAQARSLQHAATHDPLTDLHNRSSFFTHLDSRLGAHETTGVLYMDLDAFKPLNDRFGHALGDQVLCRVARRLEATARPNDLVARLGGDEFAVMCPGAGVDDLIAVADRLLDVLHRPIQVAGQVHRVGVTIGLATAEPDTCDADELVARADRALLSGKLTAKGHWHAAPLADQEI